MWMMTGTKKELFIVPIIASLSPFPLLFVCITCIYGFHSHTHTHTSAHPHKFFDRLGCLPE